MNSLKGVLGRMLRWSERYTRTDMIYLASGGFWLTAAQAVTALSGFLLAIAFAAWLPKETYGVYRFILSASAVFAATTFSGLNTALTRAVANGNPGAYFAVFNERVKWGCLGALAALGVSGYYLLHGNETFALAFLIVAVVTPLADSFNVYAAYRAGLKEFRFGAITEMVIRLVGALVMFGALLVTMDVLILIVAYLVSYTLLRFAFFMLAARRIPRGGNAGDTLIYGRHLSAQYLMGAVAAHADKIAVYHFAGPAALAAYAFAALIPEQLRTGIKNIAVLAFPKFASQELGSVLQGLSKKNVLVGLGTLFIGTAYVLVAPFLFALVFPSYMESVTLTMLLTLSLVDVLTLLPLSAMKAHQETANLYRYNAVVSVIQIVLIGGGGALGGLYGVIWGVILGRVIAVGYAFVVMRSIAR